MNLRYIRDEKELKQEDVAKMLGVSRSVYGMWEQEHDIIPIKRLNDFCNIFDVSFDYALGLTKDIKYNYANKNINKDIIKVRVKELRISLGLTQKELAEKLGITRSLISKYETGVNLILTGFLVEYAKFFNVSADYIVGRINYKARLKAKVKEMV